MLVNCSGSGMALSTIAVAPPSFSPAAGNYYTAQDISVLCATLSATIRYTTNGDTPIVSSTEYTTPINISVNTTLKAKAWKDPLLASNISSGAYIFPILLSEQDNWSSSGMYPFYFLNIDLGELLTLTRMRLQYDSDPPNSQYKWNFGVMASTDGVTWGLDDVGNGYYVQDQTGVWTSYINLTTQGEGHVHYVTARYFRIPFTFPWLIRGTEWWGF